MAPNYDILAVDLDGTLLRPDGSVSEANRIALDRARDAGMDIVICTGRGLSECAHVCVSAGQTGPVVVASGSITADPTTGATLHRVPMQRDMLDQAVAIALDADQVPAVYKDAHAAGYDYLLVQAGERQIDPVLAWWFDHHGLDTRTIAAIADDPHPELTVRVGVCVDASIAAPIAESLALAFGPRATMHNFPAVVGTEHGERVVHIIEVFDARAHKWAAIERLATERRVPISRVAAIGDEVNDVTMLRGAGLGIAMGNAVPEAVKAADVRTESNTEDGVARAIERILDGAW